MIIRGQWISSEAFWIERWDECRRIVAIPEALVGEHALSEANVVSNTLDDVFVKCSVEDAH